MTDRFRPDLVRSSLDLMVLSALADGAKYGYLLQQRLRDAAGEKLPLAAGTLYPLLHRLEADGYVTCTWDTEGGRKRKWYSLTTAGESRLKTQAAEWSQFADCVMRMLSPVLKGPRTA